MAGIAVSTTVNGDNAEFLCHPDETLLDVDCDAPRSQFVAFAPIDIAVADGGGVWVGSARSLGRWEGGVWREYSIPAARVALAADGSVWARGWDGRVDGRCCVTRLSGETTTVYDEADQIPMPPDVREHLAAGR